MLKYSWFTHVKYKPLRHFMTVEDMIYGDSVNDQRFPKTHHFLAGSVRARILTKTFLLNFYELGFSYDWNTVPIK